MNKKDISSIKKEFSLDSYKLKIKEIYSVYIKKDNRAIIHSEAKYFDMLDAETQELYFTNFKKVLSGNLDTKLFQLDFNNLEAEDSTQKVLYSALSEDDIEGFQMQMNKVIDKVIACYNYDMDVVMSFIRADYYKGVSEKIEDYSRGEDDSTEGYQFIMATVNKVEIPKKTLMFDVANLQLRANSSLDITINLANPLEGFTFPIIDNGYSDVNKVLYYTSKIKERDTTFLEGVLGCEFTLTAEEEKDSFNTIISTVTAGKLTPTIIQDIYEEIYERAQDVEEGETPTIGAKDIKSILECRDIEVAVDVEQAYEEVLATKEKELKVENVLPKQKGKSIKISNEDTNITISPKNLSTVKQVRDKNGNKCLLIQLTEDVVLDGLPIDVEEEF